MQTVSSKAFVLRGLAGIALAFALQAAVFSSETWPQFRGPSGQGTTRQTHLPRVWNRDEGIVWKTVLPGIGHSSPVHDGSVIWLTTAKKDGTSMSAVALDAASGRILHQVTIFTPAQIEEIHHSNSYASPTPVLHQGRLYVHFGTYGTACVETLSGQILWKNTGFPVAHDGGPGSSPIVHGDLLLLTLDGADTQRVVALELETGKMRWTRERSVPYPANPVTKRAFSTPLVIEHRGLPMLISPGAQQCHAYDPQTGQELWHVRFSGFSTVPRPVYNGQHCFLCTGFYQPELWAIDPGGSGNVTRTHIKWKFKGEVSETPSPLIVDDAVYVLSNKGILTILNAETGKRQGVLRMGGNYSASPILADRLAYFCNEEGMVKLVDSALAKPKIIQINRMEERIMASPAVLENDLIIRTDAALYRVHGSH